MSQPLHLNQSHLNQSNLNEATNSTTYTSSHATSYESMHQTADMQQVRQAMILAAGKGTRMRPLTLDTPKPLISVGGQPLIVWHILALKSAGITNITINCSWLADKLMQALGDGSQFGVQIHWSVEDTPLETAGGIAYALATDKLKPEPFVLINGDVWTMYDLSKLVQYYLADDMLAHLLLIDNPDHNPTGDFSIKDGREEGRAVGKLVVDSQTGNNKTDDNKTDDNKIGGNKNEQESHRFYTFSGLSIIHPDLLASVDYQTSTPLAPLLMDAMAKQQIMATKIDDIWVDVGTPERLERVNRFISEELGAGEHKGQVLEF